MPCQLDTNIAAREAKAVPFATVYVTLSKQEHIALLWDANYWEVRASPSHIAFALG